MSDVALVKSLLGVHPDFPKKVSSKKQIGAPYRTDLHPPRYLFTGNCLPRPLRESLMDGSIKWQSTCAHQHTFVQPVMRDPIAFETLITHLMSHIFTHTLPNLIPAGTDKKIDVVVGLDARGFLLGPILAMRLGAAFVPVRKRGKLPGKVEVVSYEKEYGVVSTRRGGSSDARLQWHFTESRSAFTGRI